MATALVVDDEPGVREVVAETLRRRGFTVLEARGVEESCRVSNEYDGPIELLVVNHLLVDGIGQHAVMKIAQARPDAKVLRYSGYPRQHLQDSGGIDADVAFLQKPFRATQLIEKVREVLGWLPERKRTAGGGGQELL